MLKYFTALLSQALLLCHLSFSPMLLGESTLHVILATDLEADDIEDGVEMDLERIQKTIAQIISNADMDLNEKKFVGSRSDPKKLFQYMQNLEVEADDVIFFYFSGHGYRTKTDEECEWPRLVFEKADLGIRYEDIFDILIQKHARLTLLFADCCNNKMKAADAPKLYAKGKEVLKADRKQIKRNYAKLFLEAQGALMIASAHPTEYSYTDDDDGSLFTIAFTKSLKKLVAQPTAEVHWDALLQHTEKHLLRQAIANDVEQHPIIHNLIVEH